MKLVGYFDTLLTDTVNLSRYKLDRLDDRVDAIYRALKNDAVLGPYVRSKIAQGSWAHRTIIQPQPEKEYDADFLLQLDENPEWSQDKGRYIGEVYAALGRSSAHSDMPRSRKCRCVRLTYANLCHVDIVPYLILPDGREVIVNRDLGEWEDTNPTGFTRWMRTQDDITDGNLRKVIRLLKFLRDHKGTFQGVRSIILTTLVGNVVDANKTVWNPGYYADVPTTLRNITRDLDTWLQANDSKPSVEDPSQCGTTFDHRWDDVTYANFRDKMSRYAAAIDKAYEETDKTSSIALWQDLFGDGFKAPAPKQASGPFTPAAPAVPVRSGRAG
ncbi:nucleotidyltransferase [Micromonospora sp. FIMYZ51]|uniref:SMODS domain-containing nucleotidyltransferase n=1 Tax=Micromonospora sp. FIMYZ51 TaxID=3051832 RepID=UPI00311F9D1C